MTDQDDCTNYMISVIMATVMITLFIVLVVGAAMVHIFVTPDQPSGHTPIPHQYSIYSSPDVITWDDNNTFRITYRVNKSIPRHRYTEFEKFDSWLYLQPYWDCTFNQSQFNNTTKGYEYNNNTE